MTADIAAIGHTQCEYCDLHDQQEAAYNPEQVAAWVDAIKIDGLGKPYDCLIGVSGGFDSSWLWYLAVKHLGLRPLIMHCDNSQNESFAGRNILRMEKHLGTPVQYIYPQSQAVYDAAVKTMLLAGTPDADIVNDLYMTKQMYELARKHRIHYILNGHSFRTEGSTPKPWTRLDSGYMARLYKARTGERLPMEYRLTILDQARYGWHGIRNIRPFHHMEVDTYEAKSILKRECNWTDYDLKHGENRYTAWAGYVLLPNKFHIDKRRVYLSAQIRSGLISKVDARAKLKEPCHVKPIKDYFDHIGLIEEQVLHAPPVDRTRYRLTNYRKYRWLIWILVKAEILPYTFYVKYCR
jgi:hypothetical protein